MNRHCCFQRTWCVCSNAFVDKSRDIVLQAQAAAETQDDDRDGVLFETLQLLKLGLATDCDSRASFSALLQPLHDLRSKAHADRKAALEAGCELPVYAVLRTALEQLVNRWPRPRPMWPTPGSEVTLE